MKTKAAISKKSSTTSTNKVETTPFFQKNKNGQTDANIQTKLKVGKSKDRFEKEADSMADAVVQNKTDHARPLFGQITPFVQRQTEEEVQAKEENEEEVQMQEEEEVQMQEEEEEVQMQEEEEEVQMQEEEEEEMQAKEEEEEEVQMQGEEEEELQPKKEEETAQMQEEEEEMQMQEEEEEELQAKEEGEEEVQMQEEEEEAQMQEEEEEEAMQTKRDRSTAPPNRKGMDIVAMLKSKKGKGAPLPDPVRQKMEGHFQADFSGVNLHMDSTAVAMNKELGAQAFASGSDIFFNQGKFDPSSSKGEHLLAHELTHTIQQGAVPEKKSDEPTDIDSAPMQSPIIVPLDGNAADSDSQSTSATPAPDAPIPAPATTPDASQTPISDDGTDASGEKKPDEEPTPRSPEEDPNFQSLKENSEITAKKQKSHPASEGLAENAKAAAPIAGNEKMGEAQANQSNEMNEEQPKLFDAKSFKAALMEAIKKVLPKNEEEADQFPDSGKMDQVKGEASQKVDSEKKNAAGGIQDKSSKEPDTAAVADRPVAELNPPKSGKKPASPDADKAMPPPRNNSEVNQPLEENSKELDDEMAANEVTEEQLAKSEEPDFISALDSKKSAQEHSKTAPVEFRNTEQGMLQDKQKQAKEFGDKQVGEMFGDRKNQLKKATGNQQQSSKDNTSERERVAKEIDKIFLKTKEDVEKVIGKPDGTEGTLDQEVNNRFEMASKWATIKFENYCRREMDAYKEERYGSWWNPMGWGKRIKDTFAGMPPEVNKIYERARERYLDDMDKALTKIAEFIAASLASVKQRINQGRLDVKKFVDEQPEHLKKIAAQAASDIQDKFNELDDAVVSKQEDLIDSLAQQYKESLEAVDKRIEEMKAANRGLIDKALDAIKGIIETIKKLKQLISDLLSAIANVISVIMADPIGFMKALFAGIKKGIDNFKNNIQKHLIAGLFSWLTGALGPMGITIPENIFSLSGIFNLITQVLGLTWDAIRRKLLKVIPEPALAALEKAVEVFRMIKEKGIDGLWEFVKEKFTDLKETVIDAIKNMLITKVIQAGIKWLLSLLIPGAGFIKAIMAIKDVIVFFVESAIMLIPTLIEGIKAAAAKNFNAIATAVENGLGKLIPLIISLLARLIGISGLAKRVQKIIKKIRKRIDKQINKLVLKAKKWVRKVWKKGKKAAGKVKAKLLDWWKAKKKFKGADGVSHTLFYKGTGKSAKLHVASTTVEIKGFLQRKKTEIKSVGDPKQKEKMQKAYDKGNSLVTEIDDLENKIQKRQNKKSKDKPIDAGTKKLFGQLKIKLDSLSAAVKDLFLEGDVDYPPAILPPFNNGVRARGFKAKYVSKKTPDGSPNTTKEIPGWKLIDDYSLGDGSKWVRMHLLPHTLGGKGTASNLVPAEGVGTNFTFRDNVEHVARDFKNGAMSKFPGKPGQGNLTWYQVKVKFGHSDKKFKHFPNQISAQFGTYKFESNSWKEIPAPAGIKNGGIWSQTVNPPNISGTPEPKMFYLDTDGRDALRKLPDVGGFGETIWNERNKNGKFVTKAIFAKRMKDREKITPAQNRVKDLDAKIRSLITNPNVKMKRDSS